MEMVDAAEYNAREYAAGRLTRLQVSFVMGWECDGAERWDNWAAISSAIGRFQAIHGIHITCKAGPETRAKINEAYPVRSSSHP